jgi:transposase
MLARKRVECANQITRVRNQIETVLEQSCLKISGYLTDLLGVSGRRILGALAAGESDPECLAALADVRLRATKQELSAALTGQMTPNKRLLLRQHLEHIALLDQQMEELSKALATCLEQHHDAIERLCEIPGVAANAAEQIIAEIGPHASTSPHRDISPPGSVCARAVKKAPEFRRQTPRPKATANSGAS